MQYLLYLFEDGKPGEIHPVISDLSQSFQHTISQINCRLNKEAYLQQVNSLLNHIQIGDIYEINYCVEFYAENVSINPHEVFDKLKSYTAAPYCGLYKYNNTYIICASPECFIQKKGNVLISKPMKGTARRSIDILEDEQIKVQLQNSLKEQTENVMAVDVARNDLSRVAQRGTVKVDELFGVYTFKNVHQMVSTVSCSVKENTSLEEIINATFPAASMTGAPKIRAIELIKQHELSPRGIYSGCLGWVNDKGDFDFCVVIRTIIYDEEKKRISFHVGSAITAQCKPEEEWNECLLKAETMVKALGLTVNDIKFSKSLYENA